MVSHRSTGAGRLAARLRVALAVAAAAAVAAGVAGCGLRGLAHDQLYGSPDAGQRPDTSQMSDASQTPDAGTDDARRDDQAEPSEVGGADAGDVEGGPATDAAPATDLRDDATDTSDAGADVMPPCSIASCATDQFCDDISGRCLPRTGTGMLSGGVSDACTHSVVPARIGVAGSHQCIDLKGGFFFSQLPLGKLRLMAVAPGYALYSADVTLVPGGNTLDVKLLRESAGGCADPMPPPVMCTCTDSGCRAP